MNAYARYGFVQVKKDGRIATFCDPVESNLVFRIKYNSIEIVAFDLQRFAFDRQAYKSVLLPKFSADVFLCAREGQDLQVIGGHFTGLC